VPDGAVTGPVVVRSGQQSSIGVTFTVPAVNPVPSEISISPSSVAAGTDSIDAWISGTGFMTNSIVNYDGVAMPFTFVDSTLLGITLSTHDLTMGIHPIQVVNPVPRGGPSRNSLTPHIDGVQMSWGSSSGTIIEKNDISIPKWSGYCEQTGMFNGTITNLIIRNNLVHDTCRGFNFVATVNGISIVNNTFVNMDEYSAELDGDVQNPVVHNNIYYNITHPYVRLGAVTTPDVGNNLAYQVQGSSFPGDLWGVDPRFMSLSGKDFHLQSTSPAIDAGMSISEVPNDYEGNTRPKGPRYDIGAFEFQK